MNGQEEILPPTDLPGSKQADFKGCRPQGKESAWQISVDFIAPGRIIKNFNCRAAIKPAYPQTREFYPATALFG